MRDGSKRVRGLLDELSLEEKIRLLGGNANYDDEGRDGDVFGVERVGLPSIKFSDGPVGVNWWVKSSTCYPANIALAATFSEEMAEQYGVGLGLDCRTAGVHVLLAPGVNLYRSPLCGRNFEYLGEDPELAGKMAAAYIRGLQSKNVAATVKHLAANNQEYDRHGISSDVDERTLREIYLRPFELAVKEGEVACVMTAYGLLNGQHCSENQWLIEQVLREEWGFGDGLVMSDWTSVHSTVQTLNSGLDLEMPWAKFLGEERVKFALENGTVTEERINLAVIHRLALMERFGWLDNDVSQKDCSLPARNNETESIALEVARQGIVVLKNDDELLPASPEKISKIAVLGYHANAPIHCGGGSAKTIPHESTNLLEAIRQVYGDKVDVEYHACLQPWRGGESFESSKFKTLDGATGLSAKYFNNTRVEGSPVFEEVIPNFNIYHGEARPSESVDALLFSALFEGTLEIEHEGSTDFYVNAQDCFLTIEVGEFVVFERVREPRRVTLDIPKGKHSIRIRMEQTQTGYLAYYFGYEASNAARVGYEQGLAAVEAADLAIVATGFVAETEGESHDRDFELDSRSVDLICDVASAAPGKTCVVLYIGGAVQVAPWYEKVSSVVNLWYPGQSGALAAAEILAGQVNPSGKLPFTWEKNLSDRGSSACYHDDDMDRRVAYEDGVFTGYRWFETHKIETQFPFGYGLSYTSFAYENLKLAQREMNFGDSLEITFDITNTGDLAGCESAMIFVGQQDAPVVRPVKELKGFKRVSLQPGQSQTLSVELDARAFAYWSMDARDWVVHAGVYEISVGENAESIALKASIRILEAQ